MDTNNNINSAYTDLTALKEAADFEAAGNYDDMFKALSAGLAFNPYNYELYFSLGFYYARNNINQAFLCFQNALYFCELKLNNAPSNQTLLEDYAQIRSAMNELELSEGFSVKNTAIIIVTYNSVELQKQNISSIRSTLLHDTYKIIAVDNASSDGCREWLAEQKDIVLISNSDNRGFSVACNQGAKLCDDYDIFLLNNDTRLSQNSLFWLRMGLYENDSIGATGAVSNSAGNKQNIELSFDRPKQYVDFGLTNNIPMLNPYDGRVRLSGFAMLIRHNLWSFVGGMDEIFTPGYFEDDDLSMKLLSNGYQLLVCKNSFIYHAGSQSFSKLNEVNTILLSNYKRFLEKYNFDIISHCEPHYKLISQLPYSGDAGFNLLIIGCGLGADIAHLSANYPNANIIGLEKSADLQSISSKCYPVFKSLQEIQDILTEKVIMSVIITPLGAKELSNSDLTILQSLCVDDCVFIKDESFSVHYENIKLIIWDLDDTFWSGTLSEGNVKEISFNTNLVVNLCDCGIINSISSKNNEEEAIRQLNDFDITGAFVFNNINWMPKGPQIAKKIKDMNLRPENVLFIDDNPHNLEEAKFYVPGITVAGPECLTELAAFISSLPRKDIQHQRLAQYKVLEQKQKALSEEQSVTDFLYASNIRICINRDCAKYLDRITDLVTRSNQLNYTKKRSSKEELTQIIKDDAYDSACIFAVDNFGDYGLIGFYSLSKQTNEAVHFLFSCRVMGMGIEQYVFASLAFPSIDIVLPTTVTLSKFEKPGWINEICCSDYACMQKNTCSDKKNILLKGPCDIDSIAPLLDSFSVTREINYINSLGRVVTSHNHSVHLAALLSMSSERLNTLIEGIPFLSRGDFDSSIFSEAYDIICYSLLPDCGSAVYRRKSDGQLISFGNKLYNLTDKNNKQKYVNDLATAHGYTFTSEIIDDFSKDWEFIGPTPVNTLIDNLDLIYSGLKGSPTLILLLGSEIECLNSLPDFEGSEKRHREVNPFVIEWAKNKPNVHTINVTDFIKSSEDYIDCANHYSKRIYVEIARAITQIIEN